MQSLTSRRSTNGSDLPIYKDEIDYQIERRQIDYHTKRLCIVPHTVVTCSWLGSTLLEWGLSEGTAEVFPNKVYVCIRILLDQVV